MTQDQVQGTRERLARTLEKGDRSALWQVISTAGASPETLTRAGASLGEAACRQIFQRLIDGEPPIVPRQLARPLAHLARSHASLNALVLTQLRRWLEASPSETRPLFVLAIGECGAARAFEALLELKVFGDAPTRIAAAAGLGQIDPQHPAFPEARLAIADLLLNDRELEVRRAAASALEAHFSDRDQAALLRLSLEPDPSLRGTLKTLWARRGAKPAPVPEAPRRVLKYYIRELGPGAQKRFFREFEPEGGHLAAEGSEDREPIEPFYTRQVRTPEGNIIYTLSDGASMVELPDGSLTLPVGRYDWRTRNSATGVITIRVPADQPFEPRGTLTYRPDGGLRVRLEDGTFEEERPDGRRVFITPLGLIQVVSPRLEQGIQTDTQPDLLEKQTAHYYVLLEHGDGTLELYGGQETKLPAPEGVARAMRLPFGALRLEHRDGRITRELVAGEVSHALVGERTVTFVPRGEVTPVVGVKTFRPQGPVLLSYHDGTEVEVGEDGMRRYRMPNGGWLG